MLLFGPLPEEMAWRGYVLDGLQARWNALIASLILGIAWTLWHLPLFLIEGSYQYGLGIGTPQFWLFVLGMVPQSILMTWIYNNNRRSTVTAVLFHFMINFVGELLALSLRAETIYVASWWIAALLVIAIWKPQRFVRMKSATWAPEQPPNKACSNWLLKNVETNVESVRKLFLVSKGDFTVPNYVFMSSKWLNFTRCTSEFGPIVCKFLFSRC